MGQKIIPKSFRLDHKKNWESSWVVPENQYSNFLLFDINIRKYLKTICNRLSINCGNIVIKQKGINSLQIYLNIYTYHRGKKKYNNFELEMYEKKINIEENLQKYCNYLGLKLKIKLYLVSITSITLKQRFKLAKLFYYFTGKKHGIHKSLHFLLNVLNTAIYLQSIDLLMNFLIKNLKKTPRHLQYLRQVDIVLSKLFKGFTNLIGYKIQWKGRLNGKERARKVVFKEGPISLNSINSNLKYSCREVITPAGICSLKVWLLFK